MKHIFTLFCFLIASVSGYTQVTKLFNGVSQRYWMTFMKSNNTPSGDLLYYKSRVQPTAGVNSFDATIGRYSFTTNSEVATITLLGVEGKVYSPSNISFFPSPNGMTTDNAGYVYVTCYSANKVFKYGPIPATGNVSLSPSAVFTITSSNGNNPLAFDGSGNLYIGNDGTDVYRILAADLNSNTTATSYLNISPNYGVSDIDFDTAGNLYVSSGNTDIRVYNASKSLIKTIQFPSSNIFSSEVASDGTVFFATGFNAVVGKYDPVNATASVYAGSPGQNGDALDASLTAPYTNARFQHASVLALGGNGKLLLWDENNSNVYQLVTGALETTLPIYLLNFEAKRKLNTVDYAWKMASQEGVAGYTLESTTDGKTFKTLKSLSPQTGKLSYSLVSEPSIEDQYVRLRISYLHDKDEYSKLVYLGNNNYTDWNARLSVSSLNLVAKVKGLYNIRLTNVAGQQVFNKQQALEPGANAVALPAGGVQASQIYILSISRAGYSQVIKLQATTE